MIFKRLYKRNKFIAAEMRREVRGKSENETSNSLFWSSDQCPSPFMEWTHGVSDVLGTTRRRRRPATSHKYGIWVFGALSIKRNPDSCCCFYDSYCIHRFSAAAIGARRCVIGNMFATKTSFRLQNQSAARFLYVVKFSKIFAILIFLNVWVVPMQKYRW